MLNRYLKFLPHVFNAGETVDNELISNPEKLKVMCITNKYPQYSETYMHEELSCISELFTTRIYSYAKAYNPRKNHLPYKLIEYKDDCINWGNFDQVNLKFTNKLQRKFLSRLGIEIKKYKPDILHGHFLNTALITRQLSDSYNIPFSIRTHSFDMLHDNPKKTNALLNAVNTELCVSIFTFPEFEQLFLDAGIGQEKIVVSWPVVNIKRFYNLTKPERTNRILCCGPCVYKKDHGSFIEFASRFKNRDYEFSLYTRGDCENEIKQYNESINNPVIINYAEPEEMPVVYRNHDWLVYSTDTEMKEVGLPCAIMEAQASGLGICWQEIPGRRQAQLDYLGGAGFLFNSYDEVEEIISYEYPEEMRQKGYENCVKCDLDNHKNIILSAWKKIGINSLANCEN